MFLGALEPDTRKSLMVQLMPSGHDIFVQTAPSLRKINLFIRMYQGWKYGVFIYK